MKYVVARVDGSVEVLERTASLALQELQDLVGGYIEAVRVASPGTIMMMVNEEGLLLNLPQNPFCPGLVGNVVLGKTEGSEFVGLNESELSVLESAWPQLAH